MPSDARNIAFSADTAGCEAALFIESGIRTPPRVANQVPPRPGATMRAGRYLSMVPRGGRGKRSDGGLRGGFRRFAAEPVVEEGRQPIARGIIVDGAAGHVIGA